eukprot:CAMPEP_0202827178 /NCGR_PEP_ID=MMETSP1389-20130828/14100_1 /ASSEMBLY_ACC=CAM_ASM_000865 /TAXON_ID=302021 /ORGANISM="Rhodomonas sp., Strain CCMP768" /LENGTH=76 /DNA_ID=CAMNT_0049500551 /DNA_START=148 /DNA_END=378 /DNA_ORIENTATION=-
MLFKVVPHFISLGTERYPDNLSIDESYGNYIPPYVAETHVPSFQDRWDMNAAYDDYAPHTSIVRYPDRSGGPNDLY